MCCQKREGLGKLKINALFNIQKKNLDQDTAATL
jgi:hypothetical protein